MATIAANENERRRSYQQWVERFRHAHATLAQIVLEDFPDPNGQEMQPAPYDVDSMRDLALRMESLVWGYERRT